MKNLKFLLLFFLFASCNYPPVLPQETIIYQKGRLSFQLPKSWKVTVDKSIEDVENSRLISATNGEKGDKEDIIVITSIEAGNTLSFTMDNIIKEYYTSYEKKKIEFSVFKHAILVTFGTHKTLRSNYETIANGYVSEGTFTVFDYKGKTYSFITSAAERNSAAHVAVVDSVIKSLK